MALPLMAFQEFFFREMITSLPLCVIISLRHVVAVDSRVPPSDIPLFNKLFRLNSLKREGFYSKVLYIL